MATIGKRFAQRTRDKSYTRILDLRTTELLRGRAIQDPDPIRTAMPIIKAPIGPITSLSLARR